MSSTGATVRRRLLGLLLVAGVMYLLLRARKIRIFGAIDLHTDAGWAALKAAVRAGNPRLAEFEASCFDGRYITGDVTPEYLDRLEASRQAADAAEIEGLR